MRFDLPSSVTRPAASPSTHRAGARSASALRLVALLIATALVLCGTAAVVLMAALTQLAG